MTVQILQFGTTGQLATELLRQAPVHDVAITALGRADADLSDPAWALEHVLHHCELGQFLPEREPGRSA